jgi:hypothetical protein
VTAVDLIAQTLRTAVAEWAQDPLADGSWLCPCGEVIPDEAGDVINAEHWATHAAQAVTEALGLVEEAQVRPRTDDLGLSNWTRYVTPWKERTDAQTSA